MTECIAVWVSVGSVREGERIGRALVDERLAACVNIVGPVRSIYRWRGAVQDEAELLLIIKTRTAVFQALQERIKSLHSYATPEIVAVPLTAGSAAYLEWVRAETEVNAEVTSGGGAKSG